MEKKPHNNAHILNDAAIRETKNIERPVSHYKPEALNLVNKKTGKLMIQKMRKNKTL